MQHLESYQIDDIQCPQNSIIRDDLRGFTKSLDQLVYENRLKGVIEALYINKNTKRSTRHSTPRPNRSPGYVPRNYVTYQAMFNVGRYFGLGEDFYAHVSKSEEYDPNSDEPNKVINELYSISFGSIRGEVVNYDPNNEVHATYLTYLLNNADAFVVEQTYEGFGSIPPLTAHYIPDA